MLTGQPTRRSAISSSNALWRKRSTPSALESLEGINHWLKDSAITFHLSEVMGPVIDRLKRSHFLEELTGKVQLTQYDAVSSISLDLTRRTLDAQRIE